MISVVMATYNGESYIREQLESILSQLGPDDEVIISDDSSSDNTINIIESFNDMRIIIHKDNTFRSPIFNLENALKHAKGDYIFLADQDDVWYPEKVSKTLPLINTRKGIVMSNADVVDQNLNFLFTLDEWRSYKHGFVNNIIKPKYVGCCMAFHRKHLNLFLPFPKSIQAHDVWLGLLSELNGGTVYLKEPLIKYRRHGTNFSTVGSESKNSILFMINYRVIFLFLSIIRTLANKFKTT